MVTYLSQTSGENSTLMDETGIKEKYYLLQNTTS